jgi:CheY-like chemotaxis protein
MQSRLGADRRKALRGGRRATDRPGSSPLVLVVEPDATRADLTEAVLAGCRFAVAPVVSVEAALTVSRTLQPAVIVCDRTAVDRLREMVEIPVVPTDSNDGQELIESIRQAIRQWRARHGSSTPQ